MSPESVIDAYVNDVARRLPGKKRNDTAFELKALLMEELAGKAAEAGRPADEAMALELVRAFGAPNSVADRYRPAGIVIIPPQDSRIFIWLALGGVALQWLLTLPAALSQAAEPGREHVPFMTWYFTQGLGAFWWPGFMIVMTIIAAFVREKWPPAQDQWRPRAPESDAISRPVWMASAIAAMFGVVLLTSAVWFVQSGALPPHLARVFTLDPDVFPLRAAIVVLLWIASGVHFALVYFEGRWRPLTRRLELAMSVVWIATMIWLMAGPSFFANNSSANDGVRGGFGIILLILLIDIGVKLYREVRRVRAPAEIAALAKN